MNRVITLLCTSFVLFGLVICSGCGWWPGREVAARIAAYSDSGCLSGTGDDRDQTLGDLLEAPGDYPRCSEDQIELIVEGRALNVLHRNATYNCCPDDIAITLSVEGTVVRLTEEEDLTTGGCFCLCCYDVEATAVGLAPGEHTVQFCWEDHETGGQECYTEDLVIP